MTVAALYVETDGAYFGCPGVEPWDRTLDARRYDGPHPIVAHPPCARWSQIGQVAYARYGRDELRPTNDRGVFARALWQLCAHGGVLEHPANSLAWRTFGLPPARLGRWTEMGGSFATEVWQSAYGHMADKRTWLLYVGRQPPFQLDWSTPRGTHVLCDGGEGRPQLPKRLRSRTPERFRDLLVSLAEHSSGVDAAVHPGLDAGCTGDYLRPSDMGFVISRSAVQFRSSAPT